MLVNLQAFSVLFNEKPAPIHPWPITGFAVY